MSSVAHRQAQQGNDGHINKREYAFGNKNIGQKRPYGVRRLCYGSVVVALQTKIEQHMEYNTKVEQRLVLSVFLVTYGQLHITVDTENPYWFYDNIDQYQEKNILNKETAQER